MEGLCEFYTKLNNDPAFVMEEQMRFLKRKICRQINEQQFNLRETKYDDKYYSTIRKVIEMKGRYELLFDQLYQREIALQKREDELARQEEQLAKRNNQLDQREIALNIVSNGAKKTKEIFF